MVRGAINRVHIAGEPENILTRRTADKVDRIVDIDFMDGRLIESVTLEANTANDIAHKLDRKLRGWMLMRRQYVASQFRGYRNAALNHTSSGSWQVWAVDTEDYDDGSNVASGVYTAPVDGLYAFNANMHFAAPGDGEAIGIAIAKGGTVIETTSSPIGANAINGLFISSEVRLVAGDTIQPAAYQETGGNLAYDGGSNDMWFSGRLIDMGVTDDQGNSPDEAKFLRLYASFKHNVDLWVY